LNILATKLKKMKEKLTPMMKITRSRSVTMMRSRKSCLRSRINSWSHLSSAQRPRTQKL